MQKFLIVANSPAIVQSIVDRSKIQATLSNVSKLYLSEIRRYYKYMDDPELAKDMDLPATRLHIIKLIDTAVTQLGEIKPLVDVYHALYMDQYNKVHHSLCLILKKQPFCDASGNIVNLKTL
jgi:hypothetical protein